MRVVQLTVTPDEAGVLRINIPTGAVRAQQYQVAVVLTPVENGAKPKTPEELGWPPGWENVYGSIQDEAFREYPDPPPRPMEAIE